MNDYERTETDPRYERRDNPPAVDAGPDEVEIYDRPDTTPRTESTGMGMWGGLLILIVVAVLVVLLLLFLF
jgi:hypothetical protein